MDVDAFRQFLKRGGRSKNASDRAIDYTRQFEEYLAEHDQALDDAAPADLESFVAAVEATPGVSAKLHLWGVRYYYEFIDDPVMVHVSGTMRRERVDQTPFKLHQFRGVDLSYTDKLSEVGIRSTDDLLSEARTKPQRTALADKALIPTEALDEMVRLSDLARIGGIKSIRARLYYDAGIRSVADLAKWDPIELVSILRRFVSETGFEGMAPLPGEARHAVETAKALRPLIEW